MELIFKGAARFAFAGPSVPSDAARLVYNKNRL